jgi:hypothetical protein
MALVLRWHGNKFNEQFRRATATGILRASVYYHNEVRRAVSVPNSGERRGRRTVYPNPSRPGEPPRLRTGFGQRNILREFSRPIATARVGIAKNAMYMFYLEIGTRRIARRPFLLATLTKHREMIGKLAATGGKHEIQQ